MNWSHLILAGYAGALITILVGLVRKKKWIGKGGAIVLTLLAIVLWNIGDIYYLRKSNVENNVNKLDVILQNVPTYKVIEEYDSQAYSYLREQMVSMIKDKKDEQEFIDTIQPKILEIQRKQLKFAPDDQVVALMKMNMEQVKAIQKVSNENCYRFLFPGVQGGINPVKILSHDILTRRLNTDAEMMRSSYGPNRHTVTSEEKNNAQKDVQLVVQKLMLKYGDDTAILDDPRKGLGKEKVACDLMQDMWNSVISMPEKKAAGIIRMIITPE